MRFPFQGILGIDQVGSNRPLQVALVTGESLLEGPLRVRLGEIRSFRAESFQEIGIDLVKSPHFLAVDCVFWPFHGGGMRGLKDLFLAARRSTRDGISNRDLASGFFQAEMRKMKPPPREFRQVDLLTGAQSVFRTHPFQRNIQTGTYRIWRDLAEESVFDFWPWKTPQTSKKSQIAEGYPSLWARSVFGLKFRDAKGFLEACRKKPGGLEIHLSSKDQKLIMKSGEALDSAILALGSAILARNSPGWFQANRAVCKREGWILGLES